MNSILKSIILFLSVNLISTKDAGVLFDLNEMYSQGTLQTFLGLQDAGYPLTITDCIENPVFKITQKVIDPPSMIKG